MAQQTAVEFLLSELDIIKFIEREKLIMAAEVVRQAKAMEKEQRIKDYNAGFDDAKCNHINDAENYAYEIEYIKSKIDKIDSEIKAKQDNIADMLINGMADPNITDYRIGHKEMKVVIQVDEDTILNTPNDAALGGIVRNLFYEVKRKQNGKS